MAQTFEQWMALVDDAIDRIVGLSSSDIEDYDYRGSFDAGASPRIVAKSALANSGFTAP
jgi:Family of unknown function (DUF5419)